MQDLNQQSHDHTAFLGVDGAVLIGGNVYPQTKAASDELRVRLRSAGYEVEWNKGFALLDVQRGYMCNGCSTPTIGYPPTRHGSYCDHCKTELTSVYEDGNLAAVRFKKNGLYLSHGLEFLIHRYSAESKKLYLYANGVHPAQTMHKLRDRFTRTASFIRTAEGFEGRALISIPFDNAKNDRYKSQMADVTVHARPSRGYREITIFRGKIYVDDLNPLPYPQLVTINRDFVDKKLSMAHVDAADTIIQASGVLTRDEEHTYDAQALNDMGLFVRHFTDASMEEWDAFLGRAGKLSQPKFEHFLQMWCIAMTPKIIDRRMAGPTSP